MASNVQSVSQPIANDEGLTSIYQTMRVGSFSYAIPLPAGTYLLKLRFADSTLSAPSAPTGPVATAGNGSATVSWTAPQPGGSPITGYTVTASPGGRTASSTGATFATVTGLTNGTAYTFTVTATNAIGTGPASVATAAVTPVSATTVPGAPRAVAATSLPVAASVSWTSPAVTGGSPITRYTVTSSPGGLTAATTGATSVTVTGLTAGTAYTFTVTAANSAGAGPASASSNSVTPTSTVGVPGAPTRVVATVGDASASLTWVAPASNGGSPITSYDATCSPGGGVAHTTGATATPFSGLTNGVTYTWTVTATNAAGTGPPSAVSNAVTPVASSGPPPPPSGIYRPLLSIMEENHPDWALGWNNVLGHPVDIGHVEDPAIYGWDGLDSIDYSNWNYTGLRMVISIGLLPPDGSTLAQGATGAYNQHFINAAQRLVNEGHGNAILRLGWEFNVSQGYAWNTLNDTDNLNYAAMWRQVVPAMRSVPGANFKFDWNPVTGNDPSHAYPGDAYVDIISCDIYNTQGSNDWNVYVWGKGDPTQPYFLDAWSHFAAGDGLGAVPRVGQSKAMAFPEWGVAHDYGGFDDPTFVQHMYDWAMSHNFAYISYFDVAPNGAKQRWDTTLAPDWNPLSRAKVIELFGANSPFWNRAPWPG